MAIGNAIKGFAQGYGLGEQTKQRKDEQAYREERDSVQDERYERKLGLAESQAEQQAAKERREAAAESLRNSTRAAVEYLRGRNIRSPDQMTDTDRKRLSGILTPAFQGVQVDPEFMASEEGARATQLGDQVAESGDLSPLADPEARRLAGEASFGGFVRQGEGQKSRSGKPRKRQRVVDVTPTERPGQLAVVTRVSDDDEEYDAPLTERRSADEDDPVRTVPMEQAMDRFLGYRTLSHGLEDEGLMPYLRATYAQAGGDPSELRPEVGYKTIKEGGKEVTYRTEDGRIVGEPIAEAGRWKPDTGPKPTSDMQEYEFDRSQGYEGSFREWKRDVGSGGRPKGSMSQKQRTDFYREQAIREVAQKEGVAIYKDPVTGVLDIYPVDPDNPKHVKAARDAHRDIGATVDRALEQDLRGEVVTGLADVGAGPEPRPSYTPSGKAGEIAVRVNSPEELEQVQPGTRYVAPDGSIRIKQ